MQCKLLFDALSALCIQSNLLNLKMTKEPYLFSKKRSGHILLSSWTQELPAQPCLSLCSLASVSKVQSLELTLRAEKHKADIKDNNQRPKKST